MFRVFSVSKIPNRVLSRLVFSVRFFSGSVSVRGGGAKKLQYKTLRTAAHILFSIPQELLIVNSQSTQLTPSNTYDKIISGVWLRLGVDSLYIA